MRIITNLIICVFAVQFTVGCAASLPEQCRQLKIAKDTNTEADLAYEKETNESKKDELLSESFSQKAKRIEKIQISDNSLKAIQKRLIKNDEDFTKFASTKLSINNGSEQLEKAKELSNESKNIDSDFKAICSSL